MTDNERIKEIRERNKDLLKMPALPYELCQQILESQVLLDQLTAMTARAEKAERERDRAIEDLKDMAENIRGWDGEGCCFACVYNDASECPGEMDGEDRCLVYRGIPAESEG